MGTYSEHEWREMERDPAHDKRPAATPRGSFTDWVIEQMEDRAWQLVEQLIDDGWPEAEAREHAQQMIEDGV